MAQPISLMVPLTVLPEIVPETSVPSPSMFARKKLPSDSIVASVKMPPSPSSSSARITMALPSARTARPKAPSSLTPVVVPK
jgi:hypothetical protein